MILSVSHLMKSVRTWFGSLRKTTILHDVTLKLQKWEIYAFLGPNGAWKTTTLYSIMGFEPYESGQITFFWNQWLDNTIRKRIGYAADKVAYFEHLTGRENLMLIGAYADITQSKREKIWQQLFEELELQFAKDRYVHTYSQGMKQRLWIIISLINEPELIIRDEPMNWLDPLGRIVVKNLMKRLQSEWKTIFFSTHILSDVEEVATKFGILVNGRIVYEQEVQKKWDTLEQLLYDIVHQHNTIVSIK